MSYFLIETYLQELNNEDSKVVNILKKIASEPSDKIMSRFKRNAFVNTTGCKKRLKKIRHLKTIDKLEIDKTKSLIMGSSVLVLHGLIDKNDDLDLIVTRDEFNKAMKRADTIKQYKKEYNKVFIQSKNRSVELAVNFQILGMSTERLIQRSLSIEGYNFMNLRDTYKMYKLLNRDKDSEKIKRLEKVLRL